MRMTLSRTEQVGMGQRTLVVADAPGKNGERGKRRDRLRHSLAHASCYDHLELRLASWGLHRLSPLRFILLALRTSY